MNATPQSPGAQTIERRPNSTIHVAPMKEQRLDNTDLPLAEIVDSTRAAPQGDPCDACGAPMDLRDEYCAACGNPNVTALQGSKHVKLEQRYFKCNGCGSEVAIDKNQRSYVCAFCNSTYVVEFDRNESDRHSPDFVIGFSVTSDDAYKKFRKWIKSNSWFRPGDLKHARINDKLVGAYIPFWSFSMLAQSNWTAEIGEYWYRTETYTVKNSQGKTVTRTRQVRETEWWNLAGKHHQYYLSFLVSGSRGLTQKEAEQIKPFQLPALKRYAPYYLAGWLCEEYSVSHEDALSISQDVFLGQEHENISRFMPGDTYRHLDVQTWFSYIHSDLCLLPVYVWSYRYKEKLYRFIVNGQTGRVTGTKPVSGTRVTLFVILLLVLIVVVFMIAHISR